MDFWDVIAGRRSVRAFKEQPVPRESLERALTAAQTAPSSKNSQPWRFHVCTGESRAKVAECVAQGTTYLSEYVDQLTPEQYEWALGWYSTLGNAPVLVAVSRRAADGELDDMNSLLSVGGAVQNLLLALHAEGLGACNITFVWWVKGQIAEVLGMPEDERLTALVAVGHPADDGFERTPRADHVVWHD